MKFSYKRIVLPMAASSAFFAVSMAMAQSASAQVSFATFTEKDTTQVPFTFTDNGSSSALTAKTDVVWNWLTASGDTTVGSPIDATMTLTAVATGKATTSPTLPLIRQGLSITDMVFTDNANGKILLSIAAPEAASFIGVKNTSTATVTSTGVDYSSNFLTFGTPDTGKLTLALASISPKLGQGSDKYLGGFLSTGTGTFSNGTRPVPELGTVMSLGMMITGSGMFGFRRRRKATSSPAGEIKTA